jgi:hypothetical protein
LQALVRPLRHVRPVRAGAAAATADTVLTAPAYATAGAPGSPRLLNRQLQTNPLSTFADLAAAKAGQWDLWLAAAVDRRSWAPAAAAGAGLALGLVSSRAWRRPCCSARRAAASSDPRTGAAALFKLCGFSPGRVGRLVFSAAHGATPPAALYFFPLNRA